jgi:holo-[acyl-carrier protein] synthase
VSVADPSGLGVVGLGTDLLEVPRLRTVIARRPGLVDRCFTDGEREDLAPRRDAVPGLAARFAAKEAVMKALGVGIGAVALREVEVRRTADGAPEVVLHGRAAALATARGVTGWRLSLSHTGRSAMAVALALG